MILLMVLLTDHTQLFECTRKCIETQWTFHEYFSDFVNGCASFKKYTNINGWTIWPLTSLFLFLKSWCSPLTVESHSGCKSFCFCNLFSDSLSFLSASLKKKTKKQGNLIFISKQIKKRNWNDHFNQMHYRLLLSFLPHWLSADLPVSVMKNLP